MKTRNEHSAKDEDEPIKKTQAQYDVLEGEFNLKVLDFSLLFIPLGIQRCHVENNLLFSTQIITDMSS